MKDGVCQHNINIDINVYDDDDDSLLMIIKVISDDSNAD